MVAHLGRLKVVTRRKDGTCNYKYCDRQDKKVSPGEKVFIITKMGKIGTRMTIFYKTYHRECFGPWAIWTLDQVAISKDGRKEMALSPEDKLTRQKLVTTRARLLRNLRTVTGERLAGITDHIAELDKQITATGYPILQYRGRKSTTKVKYDRFLQEVKKFYQAPERVGQDMRDEAAKIGMLDQFRKDMDAWYYEKQQATIAKQGEDYEARQEDRETE